MIDSTGLRWEEWCEICIRTVTDWPGRPPCTTGVWFLVVLAPYIASILNSLSVKKLMTHLHDGVVDPIDPADDLCLFFCKT